jgi:hypothetical protein
MIILLARKPRLALVALMATCVAPAALLATSSAPASAEGDRLLSPLVGEVPNAARDLDIGAF